MPLYIVKQDITKMKCDVIVNPTNTYLLPGRHSTDGAIFNVAGEELFIATRLIGRVGVGRAILTPAYKLPSKYVIHTSGPVWHDGFQGEQILLESCYQSCLELAVKNKCESIAFPLISSGTYNYPKDKVLSVAVNIINLFLRKHELDVYIVIYNKDDYEIDKNLKEKLSSYILNNYYPTKTQKNNHITIEQKLKNMDDSFALELMKFMDKKKITHKTCYKNANIKKQTWHKILSDENYKPSKQTVLCFALSLKLDIEETQHLLATAGFTLSKSNKFDIIIEYFIKRGEYNINKINEVLFDFGQRCLGY